MRLNHPKALLLTATMELLQLAYEIEQSQSPEGSSTHCNPAPNPLPCERPQSSLRDPRRCRLQLPGYRAPRHHMSCLSPIFSNTSASRALTGIFSPRERSRKRGGEQPTALPVFETPFPNAGDYTTKEVQSNHLHANSRVPHEMARGHRNHPKALLIIFTSCGISFRRAIRSVSITRRLFSSFSQQAQFPP